MVRVRVAYHGSKRSFLGEPGLIGTKDKDRHVTESGKPFELPNLVI